MKKHTISLFVAGFGALLALIFAIFSTSQHIRIQNEGFETQSFCAISERINCDIVNASSYSEFLGLPIAWWGVAYYSLLLILAIGTILWIKNKRASASFAWLVSCGGILYSGFLAYIATAVLGVVCIECLGMYLGTLLAFLGFFPSLEINMKSIPLFIVNYLKSIFGKSKVGFQIDFAKYATLAAALFLAVSISYPSIAGDAPKGVDKKTAKNLTESFFSQSGYNIQIDPNWPMWGNPKGNVVIVEYSEFQCPFCKLSALNVKPYLYEFKNNVRYYFVNFPLDSSCNPKVSSRMHPMACLAASAGVCAHRFGDFWGYHDDLFRDQKKISKQFILKLAEDYGWDPKDFDACLTDPSTLERLISDINASEKVNIEGTPTIFINNKPFKYWRDPNMLRAIIKEEIKRSK